MHNVYFFASGSISVATGSASDGSNGEIDMTVGSSSNSAGGNVHVSVRDGSTIEGGVTIEGGDGSVHGSVQLKAGSGTQSTGGGIMLRGGFSKSSESGAVKLQKKKMKVLGNRTTYIKNNTVNWSWTLQMQVTVYFLVQLVC